MFIHAALTGDLRVCRNGTDKEKIKVGENMDDKARFEQHALNLGKLTGNLQTIEMAARLAIVKLDKAAAQRVQALVATDPGDGQGPLRR